MSWLPSPFSDLPLPSALVPPVTPPPLLVVFRRQLDGISDLRDGESFASLCGVGAALGDYDGHGGTSLYILIVGYAVVVAAAAVAVVSVVAAAVVSYVVVAVVVGGGGVGAAAAVIAAASVLVATITEMVSVPLAECGRLSYTITTVVCGQRQPTHQAKRHGGSNMHSDGCTTCWRIKRGWTIAFRTPTRPRETITAVVS